MKIIEKRNAAFFHLSQYDIIASNQNLIKKKSYCSQAFSALSDQLTPLVDGVRDNKVHWLQLAQNAQNNPNRLPMGVSQSVSLNNNNNNNSDNDSRSKGQKIESNGGIITDSKQIPKIVGKLGRFDSQTFYQKHNGSINESRDHDDEAMDQ